MYLQVLSCKQFIESFFTSSVFSVVVYCISHIVRKVWKCIISEMLQKKYYKTISKHNSSANKIAAFALL